MRALEAIGCSVLYIEEPVDLLVGRAGSTYLLEVKNPDTSHGLTDKQQKFIAEWRGGPVHVVETVEEACRVVTVEQLPF